MEVCPVEFTGQKDKMSGVYTWYKSITSFYLLKTTNRDVSR